MRQLIFIFAISLAYCWAANFKSAAELEEDRMTAEREFANLNAEELEVAKQWKDILARKRELARDQQNSQVARNWEEALEERDLEEEMERNKRGESCIIGDVIFILDSSGSIGIDNWKFVLDFVNVAIGRMNIGPLATRVGLVTYGNRAHVIFNLNNFTTAAQMAPVVSAAKFLDENTNTSGAIWMATKVMLTAANGARDNAPDMIIVITDGESTYDHNLTLPYAQEGKAAGILFISIGVGNQTSQAELKGMASVGGDGQPLVFQVGSYAMLKNIQDTLATVACDPIATQGPTGPTEKALDPAAGGCVVPTTALPDCPVVTCKNRCPFGFLPDNNGCVSATCGCLPQPQSQDCGATTAKP